MHDVADVAVELGREVGVAAVEGEAMHAARARQKVISRGRAGVADVADAEAAAQLRTRPAARRGLRG